MCTVPCQDVHELMTSTKLTKLQSYLLHVSAPRAAMLAMLCPHCERRILWTDQVSFSILLHIHDAQAILTFSDLVRELNHQRHHLVVSACYLMLFAVDNFL